MFYETIVIIGAKKKKVIVFAGTIIIDMDEGTVAIDGVPGMINGTAVGFCC